MIYLKLFFSLFLVGLISISFSSCDMPEQCNRICDYAEDCWGSDGKNVCTQYCPENIDKVKEDGYDPEKITDCFLLIATCNDLLSNETMESIVIWCEQNY